VEVLARWITGQVDVVMGEMVKLEDGTIVIIRLSSSSKTTPSRRALRVRVPQAMSQGLAEEIAMLLSSWLHASHSDWVHITSLSQIGSAVQLRLNVLNYS
jgi:hypothetical protein